ncbi:hypothetical protein GCM10029992_14720 [Glycomyces albus]
MLRTAPAGSTSVCPAATFSVRSCEFTSAAPEVNIQICSRSMVWAGPATPGSMRTFQVLSSTLPRLGAARPVISAAAVPMTFSSVGVMTCTDPPESINFTYMSKAP